MCCDRFHIRRRSLKSIMYMEILWPGNGMDSKDTSATGRHGPDLALMRLGREMRRRVNPRASLAGALRDAAARMHSDAVMLWIPACGLRVPLATLETPLPDAMLAEFNRLPQRLAEQMDSPEAMARVVQGDEPDVTCRLLIIAAESGSPRAPAWLVFARALERPRFDTWSTVLGNAQAMRLACRLTHEVDSLTGHLSRMGLHTAIAHCRGGAGTLLLAELDDLRALNHTCGFVGGDEAIAAFGRRLTEPLLPDGSLVAHLGAGRFAVALPEADPARVTRVGARIQHALSKIIIEGKGGEMRLSGSWAGVPYDFSMECLDQALLAAEQALHQSQAGGGQTTEPLQSGDTVAQPCLDPAMAGNELLEAIAAGELELHARSIVSLRDGLHPPGFELQMKSRAAPGSQQGVWPASVLEIAERFQLLSALDRYMVDQALAILAPYRESLARQRVTVAISISGQSLGDTGFIAHFISELRGSKLVPGCIVLQVTGQAVLADPARAEEAMRRLRTAGCGIAVEGFGTVTGLLAQVHRLPVTRLKIDGSLIQDITSNRQSEATVKTIVQVARSFVLQTVGGQVETSSQAELLRRLGVDSGEGHLFGKAGPLEAAIVVLAGSGSATDRINVQAG
jgi:EAL domain-containing protein (putative c-di-GMP-specific phosphodiesterase class I)/GGDEF domain-containing protein